MAPKLLIDADGLVYQMGYAAEKRQVFANGTKVITGDLPTAKRLINRAIKKYCEMFQARDYVLVLSGKSNYRFDFYPQYKANRKVLSKPVNYEEIRAWFLTKPECLMTDGEEADDWMSALQTINSEEDQIIISKDKDFYTVPGRYYNISSELLFDISLPQAFCFLFFQALAGDRVDGYGGVAWLGERKVKKLLQTMGAKTVRQAYLAIKKFLRARARNRAEYNEAVRSFRLSLDLAALRWYNEVGERNIGLRRVFKYRNSKFEYFLPYYDLAQNLKHGVRP